jgi:hypothetical protein
VKYSCYLLWLEGVQPELLDQLPALAGLAQQGVDLRLAPLPLGEPRQCYYQLATGMGSGRLGRFDAVRPEAYQAVQEADVPEGALGHLLPDVLRARRLPVLEKELTSAGELEALQELIEQPYALALVRVRNTAMWSMSKLEALTERFMALANGHVAVLTDVWAGPVHSAVNANDFLADLGLLEVGAPRQRETIVWSETLAYTLGSGQVWVNMRGREPQGIVCAGQEYEEVRTALIRELQQNWRNPSTQEPIVERVFRKEEVYTGDYLFKAPDLVITYRPGYAPSVRAAALDLDGRSVQSFSLGVQSATVQASYARMIASGPTLVQGQRQGGRLVDVLPSLLYLLGQALPYGIDGEVLLPLFTDTYHQQQRVEWADDESDMLSDEEEGMIVDRLRSLGYLG